MDFGEHGDIESEDKMTVLKVIFTVTPVTVPVRIDSL